MQSGSRLEKHDPAPQPCPVADFGDEHTGIAGAFVPEPGSFPGDVEQAAHAVPPFATIASSHAELGDAALRMLVGRLAGLRAGGRISTFVPNIIPPSRLRRAAAQELIRKDDQP
jgi:hypothetical protein